MKNGLLLGIARQDITPKIGGRLFGYRPDLYSESVNDNLTVTAFCFEQGKTKVLLVTVCVCLLDTKITDELREKISTLYDIPKENILISATHTHSGPSTMDMPGWGGIDEEYYKEILSPKILLAVKNAVEDKQSVTVGVGVGESKVGINRRQLNIRNYADLGQNKWGPFNPKMTVISFKNNENKIIGSIIHYGCHGTVAGANKEISRDWSGVMTDALEKETGAIVAFFNGPEGDVGPRISTGATVSDISYISEVGGIGAKDATNIFKSITEFKEVELDTFTRSIKLPYAKRISLEEAISGCEKYTLDAINCDKQMAVYFNKVKDSYETNYKEKEFLELEQSVIRIGEIVFVGFSYELFSEIGMRIDEQFKALNILSLSNTNGSSGYFPTEDQLCRGGYEIKMFKYNNVQALKDDADYHLVLETIETIKKLENKGDSNV